MRRLPRFQYPGAIYHVFTRGIACRPIFAGDDAKHVAVAIIGNVVRRHEWSCRAWCVMNTHYHLLIATPQPDIAAGMQRLNLLYAQTFNRQRGSFGHVFAARYGAVVVQSEEHLREAMRYIVLNPVRAGICDAPDQWRWSSYNDMLTARRTFLDMRAFRTTFGIDSERARVNFREYVREGTTQPPPRYALEERIP